MSANVYDVGDLVRVSAVFKNAAGAEADPTAVSFKFRKPDGVVTTWGVAVNQIVKDSDGNFHADLNITVKGVWIYKFIGTGAVQAVEEASLVVRPSLIE